MQWEQLTSPDMAKAVKETGVCILPLGVMERHSDHLPLGTDFIAAHKIASLAAEKEAAVVFPPFYIGQVNCARCYPGAVTIKPTIMLEFIQGILDEIGRNGFKKIILYNGHGGNRALVQFLGQLSLWEEKPYSLYSSFVLDLDLERQKQKESICRTPVQGHACEWETSLLLAIQKELVRMDKVPPEPGLPLKRMCHLPTFSGIFWYADFPDDYQGDARTATVEKGQAILKLHVDRLVEIIAAVKADMAVPSLTREFFQRAGKLSD